MRIVRFVLAGALLASSFGCYSTPVIPPVGYVYSNYQAPLDVDADNTPIDGLASGETTSFSVLGLVAWGDCSLNTAASNGGLKTIEHADYKFWNVLGVYQKFTVVAYGTQ